MMSIEQYLALAATLALAMAAPGPGVISVVARALAIGWRRNLPFISGMMLGDLTLLGLTLSGLAAIATRFATAFVIMKILGGLYLGYLGVRAWRAPATGFEAAAAVQPSGWHAFASGLLLTVSNPKAILFYAAIFPALIDLPHLATADAARLALLTGGTLFSVMLGYSLACAKARRLFRSPKAIKTLNRGAGGVMVGAGIVVASS
jgi:threonine/homoserine/homoserine lactone efflux protein